MPRFILIPDVLFLSTHPYLENDGDTNIEMGACIDDLKTGMKTCTHYTTPSIIIIIDDENDDDDDDAYTTLLLILL